MAFKVGDRVMAESQDRRFYSINGTIAEEIDNINGRYVAPMYVVKYDNDPARSVIFSASELAHADDQKHKRRRNKMKLDIEFWKTSCQDTYNEAAEKLKAVKMDEQEVKALLEGLYSATREEYGD